ncbi:MAG: hypothetical protein DSO03_04550 [Hadesarchaea archaeon]|nr:MAG: hypothetical protein DSO03_04550 [Hadesarchaea archaeon]
MEEVTKAIVVVLVVMAMGTVYLAYEVSDLRADLKELQGTILTVDVGVVIDNGEAELSHRLSLAKGATALDALKRVAVVETEHYAWGEFITSINGLSNNPSEGKYWMFYIWENHQWKYASVGAGSYELRDGENVKFKYEVPSYPS